MPNDCDQACQKLLLDAGMSVFANRLYESVISKIVGLRAIDYLAPSFYVATILGEPAGGSDDCECDTKPQGFLKLSLWLDSRLHGADHDTLMAQNAKECYRSDDLIAWANKPPAAIVTHVEAWTAEIFEWAKDNQTVYTELLLKV